MTKVPVESLWYFIPDFGEIEFTQPVLSHFRKYQQKGRRSDEAGGQLFWQYSAEGYKRVAAVTGPRLTDKRTRTSYKADHIQEQLEIDEYFKKDYFFLGDWHTHPEPIARPSPRDYEAIRDIYNSSIDLGPGIALVIVGTGPLEESLSVSWFYNSLIAVERLE